MSLRINLIKSIKINISVKDILMKNRQEIISCRFLFSPKPELLML